VTSGNKVQVAVSFSCAASGKLEYVPADQSSTPAFVSTDLLMFYYAFFNWNGIESDLSIRRHEEFY